MLAARGDDRDVERRLVPIEAAEVAAAHLALDRQPEAVVVPSGQRFRIVRLNRSAADVLEARRGRRRFGGGGRGSRRYGTVMTTAGGGDERSRQERCSDV